MGEFRRKKGREFSCTPFLHITRIDTMQYILCDDAGIRQALLPLTFTRPVALLRTGITTLQEKWNSFMGPDSGFCTAAYLSAKFGAHRDEESACLWVNASYVPDAALAEEVKALEPGQALVEDGQWIAFCLDSRDGGKADPRREEDTLRIDLCGCTVCLSGRNVRQYVSGCRQIRHPWDLFLENGKQIAADLETVSAGRRSSSIGGDGLVHFGTCPVFAEEGAVVEHSLIDTTEGPVYLGRGSRIMPGCLIKGPLALCEGALIKMGSKIYGGNTFGPYCKVAGEVENSVFIGYANKAHDGFLGDAVIGEWCNLGAGTNCSNLKNDYSEVRVWSYAEERFVKTGLQFCGLVMGDHSKSAIGTQFNTGTVVGVAANVFAAGFPKNYVPSFSWGKDTYRLERALETARIVYGRRGKEFAKEDAGILEYIYGQTEKNRQRFNAD